MYSLIYSLIGPINIYEYCCVSVAMVRLKNLREQENGFCSHTVSSEEEKTDFGQIISKAIN